MKEHNPMFDLKLEQRSAKLLKKKFYLGEIIYAKGPEHHLWKGNRKF